MIPVNGSREALFAIAQAVRRHHAPDAADRRLPEPVLSDLRRRGDARRRDARLSQQRRRANDYAFDCESAARDAVGPRAARLRLLAGQPDRPRDVARRMEGALRALRPLRLRHRVRRVLLGDLLRRGASAARRARRRRSSSGATGYPRLIVFSSLSKRSNVPGMRSGFVAGDAADPEAVPALPHLPGLRDEPAHCRRRASRPGTTRRTSWRTAGSTARNSTALSTSCGRSLDVDMPDGRFYLWARTPISGHRVRAAALRDAGRLGAARQLPRARGARHQPGRRTACASRSCPSTEECAEVGAAHTRFRARIAEVSER